MGEDPSLVAHVSDTIDPAEDVVAVAAPRAAPTRTPHAMTAAKELPVEPETHDEAGTNNIHDPDTRHRPHTRVATRSRGSNNGVADASGVDGDKHDVNAIVSGANANMRHQGNRSNRNAQGQVSVSRSIGMGGGSVGGGGGGRRSGNDLLAEELAIYTASQHSNGTRRRHVDVSHLLNFQLPPRQTDPYHNNSRGRNARSSSSAIQTFSKEKFVNANYRFVMRSTGQYSVNLLDPDLEVNWSDIIQAIVPTTSIPSCPICLSPPAAPQVAKCGHIFCWPCILHYIFVGEDKRKFRKCPICFESIHVNDLRPVRFNVFDDISEASPTNTRKMKMILMKRRLTSSIALPKPVYGKWAASAGSKIDMPHPPSVKQIDASPFSKLLLSTPEYIRTDILFKEKRVLDDMVQQMLTEKAIRDLGEKNVVDSSSELPFIEMALAKIKEQLLTVDNEINETVISNSLAPSNVESDHHTDNTALDNHANTNIAATTNSTIKSPVTSAGSSMFDSTTSGSGILSGSNTNGRVIPQAIRPKQPAIFKQSVGSGGTLDKGKNAEYYYFYQANNGQSVFLHPLDVKVLKHEFGDYKLFPDSLHTTIQAVQETTLTEDLRKRCKFLSHLPLSCDVTLVQIDLERHVSRDTIRVFEKELSIRAKKQRDMDRKDDLEAQRNEEKIRRQIEDEVLRGSSGLGYSGQSNYGSEQQRDISSEADEFDYLGKGLTLSEFLESDAVKNSSAKGKKKKRLKQQQNNIVGEAEASMPEASFIERMDSMNLQVGRRRLNKKLFKTGDTLFDKDLIAATLEGGRLHGSSGIGAQHADNSGSYYYDIEQSESGVAEQSVRSDISNTDQDDQNNPIHAASSGKVVVDRNNINGNRQNKDVANSSGNSNNNNENGVTNVKELRSSSPKRIGGASNTQCSRSVETVLSTSLSTEASAEVPSTISEFSSATTTSLSALNERHARNVNLQENTATGSAARSPPAFSFAVVAKGIQKPSNSSNPNSLSTSPSMWPTLGSVMSKQSSPEQGNTPVISPVTKFAGTTGGNNSYAKRSEFDASPSRTVSSKPSFHATPSALTPHLAKPTPNSNGSISQQRQFYPVSTAFSVLVEEALPANGIANPLVASATAGETSVMLLSSKRRKQLAKQRKKEQRERLFGSVKESGSSTANNTSSITETK